MNDKTNILNRSIGASTNNNKGEFLGNITGVITDASGEAPEYVVLESNELFGRGKRYFAVPVNSHIVRVTSEGKIIIHLNKDDLQFARGISADKCPTPNPQYGLSVFELYNYAKDQTKAFNNSISNRRKPILNV